LYAVDPTPLAQADAWFDAFRGFWQPKLDALGTELARGRLAKRKASNPTAAKAAPKTPNDEDDHDDNEGDQ
ncbi:MAG: transcriptional regulator, partial [Actinomycetota bacterium]|nr:transcriptional regulator [Actinomycetota bacterium]